MKNLTSVYSKVETIKVTKINQVHGKNSWTATMELANLTGVGEPVVLSRAFGETKGKAMIQLMEIAIIDIKDIIREALHDKGITAGKSAFETFISEEG